MSIYDKVKYNGKLECEIVDIISEEPENTLYYVRAQNGQCFICKERQLELIKSPLQKESVIP